MIPDTLYALAFAFRQTKLWKKLYDSQLFAVRHTDGSIGYCCVMGMMGEHLALAVYPGNEGMDSYHLMAGNLPQMDHFTLQEIALSQFCLALSFENKAELRPREVQEVSAYCAAHGLTLRGRKAFPQFQRLRPRYLPWYVEDEVDQKRMAEALEAAIEVSKKLQTVSAEALGFAEDAPHGRKIPLPEKKAGVFIWDKIALPERDTRFARYPSPDFDEITLKRLSKFRKRGGEWACDVFMHLDPVSDELDDDEFEAEPKNAPFFPYLLLVVDNKTGMVAGAHLSETPEDYPEQFARAVLDTAFSRGIPAQILVCNERSHALFSKLAARMGTRLLMKEQIPFLEEAKQGFFEHFAGEEDHLEGKMEKLMDLLRDPKALRDVPDEMLDQLDQVTEMGALPDDIVEALRHERKRRGMR